MILGLSVATFTLIHVAISLVGIAAGFVALGALASGRWRVKWQVVFLATTIATSITGFFFHSVAIGPPHIVGVISLVDLSGTLLALRLRRTALYAITATVALYLNCFVGVVQAFQKVGPLHALAPAGTEPPFVVAQGLLLVAFIAFGVILVRRQPSIAMAV